MITVNNWSYTRYEAENFVASISYGGEISSNNEYIEIYFVNKFINEELIFQSKEDTLDHALKELNQKYGHWKFVDLAKKEKSSGCSTCQAH